MEQRLPQFLSTYDYRKTSSLIMPLVLLIQEKYFLRKGTYKLGQQISIAQINWSPRL